MRSRRKCVLRKIEDSHFYDIQKKNFEKKFQKAWFWSLVSSQVLEPGFKPGFGVIVIFPNTIIMILNFLIFLTK